ncbi:MAG: hypothetical protein JXR95_10740 [Deltaproteobacteria bacterium]|nr:hypothetical protein [Deltaproteobacteria bacterium]
MLNYRAGLLIVFFMVTYPWGTLQSTPPLNDPVKIENTDLKFTLPGFDIIGFSNQEFLSVSTGYLHYKKWFFSTMNFEGVGQNLTPFHWDAGQSLHSYYIHFVDTGRRWHWPTLDMVWGIHLGMLHSGDVPVMGDHTLDIKEKNILTPGLMMGFRWQPWRFLFELSATVTMSDFDVLQTTSFSMIYKINRNWRVGIQSSVASRELSFCSDENNDECTYSFSLGYFAAFISRRVFKNTFLRMGVVVTSYLNMGYTETDYKLSRDFQSLYFSIY